MSNMCGDNAQGGYRGYCSCGATGCTTYKEKPEFFTIYTHTLKSDGFYHPIKKDMTWAERRAHLEGMRK